MITFAVERSAVAPLRPFGPQGDHGSPEQVGGWRL